MKIPEISVMYTQRISKLMNFGNSILTYLFCAMLWLIPLSVHSISYSCLPNCSFICDKCPAWHRHSTWFIPAVPTSIAGSVTVCSHLVSRLLTKRRKEGLVHDCIYSKSAISYMARLSLLWTKNRKIIKRGELGEWIKSSMFCWCFVWLY